MTKIYLISPPQFEQEPFLKDLKKALATNLVPVFQLRLKNYDKKEIIKIAKEIKKICFDFNCLFLINDFLEIALEIGLDGVHLGLEDDLISLARKNSPKNFLIGASCYDSRHLAMKAAEQGADYISFGTFFPSITKNSQGKPTTEIITWCNEILNLPTVAIGGINDLNCKELVKANVDFIAVISYVWQHFLGVEAALKILSSAIDKNYQNNS